MTREERIRRPFTRNMRLLEIGPSYNPIVAKADGWHTTVVDHATQADLIAKYIALGVGTVDQIEPVDFIWQGGSLTAILPPELHGSYDGLIASHVGEHLPDLIAFFEDAATLLKPDSVMALALPDKRVCFDFFQPLTTTGDLVAAHREGRTRHQRRTFFNQAAYFVMRNNQGGWTHTGNTFPFHLVNPLALAQHAYDAADERPISEYRDTHAWTFTPKSFELLTLELNLLGHINWVVHAIEPAAGVEFYVWLKQERIDMPEAAANALRLSLLTAMVYENQDTIAQLDKAMVAVPAPAQFKNATMATTTSGQMRVPSIAVIVPFYNGGRYIEQTLNSIFAQTLPATEIIVVNDGSTDDGAGAAILERLAQTHPLTLLNKPNGGQSSARNFGVGQSSSDLIAFIDQDDVWYSHHLRELVQPFLAPSEPPLGWVYSNVDEIDHNGYLVCRSFLGTMPTVHPKRSVIDCIREDMLIVPSTSLVCRKAFDAVGGFDEQLCGYEDDDLFLRIFRLGYGNVYLERALSQWRIYTESTSYTYRMVLSRRIYIKKLLAMFPDDIVRRRYYTRDIIVPRFYNSAIRSYEDALLADDQDAVAAAWTEILLLVRHSDGVPPQLQAHALRRYKSALQKGGRDGIDIAWREAVEVVTHTPNTRRLRRTLNLMRNSAVSKSLFALRRIARPVMLWAFR